MEGSLFGLSLPALYIAIIIILITLVCIGLGIYELYLGNNSVGGAWLGVGIFVAICEIGVGILIGKSYKKEKTT